MWDDDLFGGDDSLGYDLTDETGYFSIGPIPNNDPAWGKQDVYLKLVAENAAAVVREVYNGSTYVIQSDVRDECPSGEFDTTIVLSDAESGAFFVVDAVLTAKEKWLQLRSDKDPGQVQVVLSSGVAPYDGSYFDTTLKYIHIETSNDVTHQWPDTFDKDVITHEYGHRLEYLFHFLDATPGGPHSWRAPFCDTCAASSSRAGASSEGFSTWWACLVKGSPRYWNIANSYHDTFYCDLENGLTGKNWGRR